MSSRGRRTVRRPVERAASGARDRARDFCRQHQEEMAVRLREDDGVHQILISSSSSSSTLALSAYYLISTSSRLLSPPYLPVLALPLKAASPRWPRVCCTIHCNLTARSCPLPSCLGTACLFCTNLFLYTTLYIYASK